MADDIVTELRKLSQDWNEELVDNPLFLRAANEIERLRQQIETLSEQRNRWYCRANDLPYVTYMNNEERVCRED